MFEKEKNEFENLLKKQINRIQKMKKNEEKVDYKVKQQIIIGICGGDGIGPIITLQAKKILDEVLKREIEQEKIMLKDINGLTIENRIKENTAIPNDVLEEIKKCDVILKGPTTTPRKGDDLPNIESANVAMRKELDLFANVRPIKNSKLNIDWAFFRENTEGGYAVGKEGINVNDDLCVDFTITTKQGTERIIRAAFEYAKNNNKTRVTAVTKANVIKTTDGKFLDIFYKIANEYKGIQADDWYIDIMTAKLIDEKRRSDFQVIVAPNLYGDILTDEAAEIQGGVGTAGSANIGNKYAMFEAIHGSAPRMVEEKREKYADPTSIIKASIMLLEHIGYSQKAESIEKALENCIEKGIRVTGRDTGYDNEVFTDKIIEEIRNIQ